MCFWHGRESRMVLIELVDRDRVSLGGRGLQFEEMHGGTLDFLEKLKLRV